VKMDPLEAPGRSLRVPAAPLREALCCFLFSGLIGSPLSVEASPKEPLRVGIIGLDTSHVRDFTQLLNDPSRPDHVPGATVVAAFKGGSRDVEASATRIEGFTTELTTKWGVELVASIEGLCKKVDAVMLTSVDGRVHLQQVRPVLAARKPVFIDKPLAGDLRQAREILRLARQAGCPCFSSSSLRYASAVEGLRRAEIGRILGAFAWGPAPLEPHHPDLFWYGIHAVEMLYTFMGPGCERVTRVHTDGADLVVGQWKDGRTGSVRGIREGARAYGVVVFGTEAVQSAHVKADYRGLLTEIVKFFETGVSPVPMEETLEILAFMEAADLSKKTGLSVRLAELP